MKRTARSTCGPIWPPAPPRRPTSADTAPADDSDDDGDNDDDDGGDETSSGDEAGDALPLTMSTERLFGPEIESAAEPGPGDQVASDSPTDGAGNGSRDPQAALPAAGEQEAPQAGGAEPRGPGSIPRDRRRRRGRGRASAGAPRPQRRYKIQEVIKRRQIMLVQVAKEERGNKGAALTTYLSLAGRYCVLMPNTGRGGGISRKITNAGDRKRLKAILDELDIPDGMAVIVRTAGSERTKTEITRDYEYLLRLWDEIRELTLQSTAPALIYEEANLIKRAIRDLYTRDIDEVLVEGDDAYKAAKDFMRMLMPSHAKRVQLYKDPKHAACSTASRSRASSTRSTIPIVQLRSGGYIVINQTEALVAIDVNSGRATRERNIEETALRTNLEAADEIARQLRLRDLAGLIVIDFIDMEEHRNNAAVERRLKEAHAARPRAHPGRPHQRLRPAGAVAPAPAAEPDRGQHRSLPPLPRHRSCAVDRVDGAARAARHRGGRHPQPQHRRHHHGADGRRALHPQPQARRACGTRAAPQPPPDDRRRRRADSARLPHGAQQDADCRA